MPYHPGIVYLYINKLRLNLSLQMYARNSVSLSQPPNREGGTVWRSDHNMWPFLCSNVLYNKVQNNWWGEVFLGTSRGAEDFLGLSRGGRRIFKVGK